MPPRRQIMTAIAVKSRTVRFKSCPQGNSCTVRCKSLNELAYAMNWAAAHELAAPGCLASLHDGMPGCLTAPGFCYATSSVTASPRHLPLKGKAFGNRFLPPPLRSNGGGGIFALAKMTEGVCSSPSGGGCRRQATGEGECRSLPQPTSLRSATFPRWGKDFWYALASIVAPPSCHPDRRGRRPRRPASPCVA